MHCYLYSTRNGATIIHDLYINLFPYFSKYVHISELIPYSSSIDRPRGNLEDPLYSCLHKSAIIRIFNL